MPTWQNAAMDIRERINQVLAENPKMTPRNVSLAAGLSDSMLHKYLTGATASMSFDNLLAVAQALKVDPKWLLFGEEPDLPKNVSRIISRIPKKRQLQAIAILETFAEKDESQANG